MEDESTNNRTPKKDQQEWAENFLVFLSETGNVSDSCIRAGIGRRTAYDRKESDPGFAALWNEALEIAIERLELEARRRAMEGVDRPIFHQGVECGRVKEFSDTLMIFLLKAHKPEKYRDNMTLRHEGGVTLELTEEIVDGNPTKDEKEDDQAS